MVNYQEIIEKIKPQMESSFHFFEKELQKIRSSRVSPSLIENIEVECFGQKFLLKQLGAIFLGENPRELILQPWDKSYLEGIEKALRNSFSGSFSVRGEKIVLSFPPLSEEYRKNLIKKVEALGESVKQKIRKWREKAWSEIQEKTREGQIREDDKYRAKDDLQKLIDEYNEKIKEKIEQKKKEIQE